MKKVFNLAEDDEESIQSGQRTMKKVFNLTEDDEESIQSGRGR